MAPRVQHCNVNCSDLDRALAFYRDEFGFAPLVRTTPEPQDGSGFGIDGLAAWDAWMLSDGRDAPVIDLLEWQVPRPTGAPNPPDGLGLAALVIEHPDVATSTTRRDPDGTPLALRPGPVVRFAGVRINATDVDTSLAWYRSVLGFEGDAAALRLADDDFTVELMPGDRTVPAIGAANQLGIFRMAILVDDAAAAVAQVRARGATCPDPVWLDMGPTIPIDGLWATFFRDPDGACVEFIQAPEPA